MTFARFLLVLKVISFYETLEPHLYVKTKLIIYNLLKIIKT
jgi:hypothetical protein